MSTGITVAVFLAALAALLAGTPVAVVMVASGALGGLAIIGIPMVNSLGSVFWSVQNDNLLTAIPLFILLGELLLRSGLADRMYNGLSSWVSGLPGGLVHTNIATCALFAATCGSSVATAATIGTVALPNLEKRGYDRRQSLGSIAAGGTLGILIPPSVAMLVYGSLTNNSIGKLFIAGIVPGILLVLAFMTLIVLQNVFSNRSRVQTEAGLPFVERIRLLRHLLPAFTIFTIVMGSIYFGLATPTEAAGLGIVVALMLAKFFGRLDLGLLHHCFKQTAVLTGMIILIMVGAFALNVTLSFANIPQQLAKWVTDQGISPPMMILFLTIMYLVLGCFLEVLSMQVLTIPITYPLIVHMGIDPIWYGVFIVLVSEIAMITPPVGMNLYVVQSIRRDGGNIGDVIAGVIPYLAIMTAFIAAIWYVPSIVLWLPNTMQ